MNTQRDAIMLLTVSLGAAASKDARPLSPKEWAKFASWLHEKKLTPASLINADLESVLAGWVDPKVNRIRLERLLGRGAALGLALEKWTRAGLWVMTRSDQEYPKRLLKRLGKSSPPVLFGCGNKRLLNSGGVSIVGSRNVSDEDASFSENLGAKVANSGLNVVSGGARGVDQLAMFGALNASGTVIGILADSLLTSAMSKKYRSFVTSGDLVLISPFNPEARFNVGNAMGRNKYIYCLSDNAVVVCSTPNKGGTWTGAIENLTQNWTPLWVKRNTESSSGNGALKERGAEWFPETIQDINALKPQYVAGDTQIKSDPKNTHQPTESQIRQSVELDFYQVFLMHVAELTKEKALEVDEIAERLDVTKTQVNLWAKRAVQEKALIRTTKPIRYKFSATDSKVA